jgi:hypothetical protein
LRGHVFRTFLMRTQRRISHLIPMNLFIFVSKVCLWDGVGHFGSAKRS